MSTRTSLYYTPRDREDTGGIHIFSEMYDGLLYMEIYAGPGSREIQFIISPAIWGILRGLLDPSGLTDMGRQYDQRPAV